MSPGNSLNEVRPRRPEQCMTKEFFRELKDSVSMKSGLEGRNNQHARPNGGSQGYLSQ